jgi:hypothetical protein
MNTVKSVLRGHLYDNVRTKFDIYVSITAYSMWPKALPHVKKYPYIINQNHIFSKNSCEVISG